MVFTGHTRNVIAGWPDKTKKTQLYTGRACDVQFCAQIDSAWCMQGRRKNTEKSISHILYTNLSIEQG